MAAYDMHKVLTPVIARYEKLGSGATVYYKMRGWDADPGVEDWETWVVAIEPDASSNPSGNPLTDVTIVDSWVSG